jgi:8-oxo-dGTP pyrophosphatase MutT (NUDIX family)
MKEVSCVAILNDHHMLMGKRRDDGKWTQPGGHLNPGEDPTAGAVREVKEETGLDLHPHLFKHLETRIVKKPSGEKLKVHGYRVDLRAKPSTSMKEDPDGEVYRWVWIKLDTDLEHIKENLHVPLKDNVLLVHILKDKPMKKHIKKFWDKGRKMGRGGFLDDLKERTLKEGPQQYAQRGEEKKAAEVVHGGKADGMRDDRFSDEQLKKGITIEKEHTTNPRLAKEIAKDHLIEDKNYYTHLKEMEDKYVEKKAFWKGFYKE